MALRYTALAHCIHGLAHSLSSLSHGMVEIQEYMFALLTRNMGMIAFVVVTEKNRPDEIEIET